MIINCKNLSLKDRVKDLTFSLKKGECMGLLGRTGSGKSSTLELISGLETKSSGELFIEGTVGYLFQDTNLQLFENSVYKELSFSLRKAGVDKQIILEKVKEALALVDLDYEKYKDALPYCLSGGEQKKVALATLLVQNSSLLLLDEPTVGLDGKGRKDFIQIIQRLKMEGKAIIIASHDLPFIYAVADKIEHLDNGKVSFSGSTVDFAKENVALTPLTRISKKVLGNTCISFDDFINRLVEVKNGNA